MWGNDWDKNASVKWLSVNHETNAYDDPNLNFFSPNLVRINAHPLVTKRGDATVRALQRRHLYRYLASTEAIEIEMVNPALMFVMDSDIARETINDAYRVYTDEGFHALMCVNLRKSLADDGEIPYELRYRNSAMDAVMSMCRTANPEDNRLILLAIACVNETMIASSLSQATDKSVYPALRNIVLAHARDEAAHNTYFSNLMVAFWPRLSDRERTLLTDLMPRIFTDLNLSDRTGVEGDLRAEGFSKEDIDAIGGEIFTDKVDFDGMRRVANSSLRMLSRSGFWKDPRAVEGFRAAGLGELIADQV
ncbi:MAG: diiron oxygenase [Pseudomonadota bacterium]